MANIKVCDLCGAQIGTLALDVPFQFSLAAEYPRNLVRSIRNRRDQDSCQECAVAINAAVEARRG